jgi:hypothetical protein
MIFHEGLIKRWNKEHMCFEESYYVSDAYGDISEQWKECEIDMSEIMDISF